MKAFLSFFVALFLFISMAFAQIDVNRVMTIGQNALFFNDYLVSIGYFNQVIELRPWMADPYYFRALSKFMLEDYKGAEEDAGWAIERNAFIAKAYLVRGLSQRALKDNAQAVVNLKKAYEFLPDDVEVALSLAEALFGDKQYEESANTIDKLLQKDKKNKYAYLLKGDLLLQSRDTVSAMAAIKNSLSIDSTQAQAYASLGYLSAQKKEYKEALSFLNSAIFYEPNDKNFYINRGLVRYHSNDYEGAIDDYSRAIQIAPNDLTARYNRALLLASLGDANNALADLQHVLKQRPNDYMALYNQGLLSMDIGDYKTALKSFNRVLERYPNFLMGLLARAEVKKALGDLAGSDRDLWQAEQQQRRKNFKKKAPKTIAKETRSEEEEAIDAYNQLIETTETSLAQTSLHVPQSLRGKIQNREVALEPLDFFTLSYFPPVSKGGLTPRLYYSALVEEYNDAHTLPKRLSLTPSGQIIDTLDIQLLQQELQFFNSAAKKTEEVYFRLGIAAFLLQDVELAERALSEAIRLNPKQPLFFFARAAVRKRTLELSRGSAEQEATSLDRKTHVMGVSSLSGLSSQPSKPSSLSYEQIRSDLDNVLAKSPKFYYAYYNRAVLLERMGQKALALEDYNRALEGLEHPEIYFNRGLLFLSLGKKEEAIKDLRKAGEGGIYQAYSIIKKTRQ